MSLLWTGPPSDEEELAVGFARGITGRMKPSPDAAAAKDLFSLLRYALRIKTADTETKS